MSARYNSRAKRARISCWHNYSAPVYCPQHIYDYEGFDFLLGTEASKRFIATVTTNLYLHP
jgi:hypothetical protein